MNHLSWTPCVEVESHSGIDIVAQLLYLQDESEEPIFFYI